VIAMLALVGAVVGQATDPVTVTGRVVRIVAGDTLTIAGAEVILHGVGPERQGPLDSTRSDAAGGFRFRVRPDSGTVLLVSARWAGVEYFAPPMTGSAVVTVVAVDTASAQPVGLAARHVILGGPAADGTRDVVDLLILTNDGERTRVGVDSLSPTWVMRLPTNIANLTVGDADFSPEAFDVHGDTLLLHAPIPPGERQFFLSYQLPPGARALVLPLGPRPDTMSVLTEERDLPIRGGLVAMGEEQVSGRQFLRFAGGGAALATTVVVTLATDSSTPEWVVPGLLAVLVLGLLVATARALLPRRE
jgi:hypothetical protein